MKNIYIKGYGLNQEHELVEEEFNTLQELQEMLSAEKDEKKREKIEEAIKARKETLQTGESVTDDSHFIPMSELVKRNKSINRLGNDAIEGIYDFANGKDTGMNVPITRRGANIAELSKSIREKTAIAKESKKELAKTVHEIAEVIE